MAKLIPITIPKWGIEMERGTISQWRVAVGATVAKGDQLVDIETDKIINSFEASHDGILVRIVAEEGDDLAVGTLIGVMASEQVSAEAIDAFIASNGKPGVAPAASEPAPETDPEPAEMAAATADGGQARISPALRRKAQRLGIELQDVSGSGHGGRILRDDIEAVRNAGQGGAPLRQLRGAQKTIAARMTLAKQTIPHFYLQRDCNMEAALGALESLREQSGTAITINHLLVHAVAGALRAQPELNLNVLPDGIRDLDSIDVAIAVDTGDSLMTPVVRDLGAADIPQVAKLAGAVVARTREHQLTAADLEGGAITVSNLGMLGVDSFAAIINPPQVMILAVGSIREQLQLKGGQPDVVRYCTLVLACDHRVINGASAARFLAAICEHMESL